MIEAKRLAEIRIYAGHADEYPPSYSELLELVTAYEAAQAFAAACAYEDTPDNTRYVRKAICALFPGAN